MSSPATVATVPRLTVTRSHLQLIAYSTMLIDHIGYIFFPDQPVWRWIGRLAFPLFAFMISQGVTYTRNQQRYLLTLLVATIVAEPAYDLALYGDILYAPRQSVMPTLLLGAVALVTIRRLPPAWPPVATWATGGAVTLAAAGGTHLLNSDYGAAGVLLVVAFAYVDTARPWTLLLPAAPIIWYSMPTGPIVILCALSALVVVYLYDPRAPFRASPKWLTYGFYPVHLAALAAIATIM